MRTEIAIKKQSESPTITMKRYTKPDIRILVLTDALCDAPFIAQSEYDPDEPVGSKGRRGVWGDLWYAEEIN